jgi:hypothetical protein
MRNLLFVHVYKTNKDLFDVFENNFMDHSPSPETTSHSASQDILRLYGARRLITVFTRACQWSLS